MFAGVLIAAAVSFAVASVLLGFGRGEKEEAVEAGESVQSGETQSPDFAAQERPSDAVLAQDVAGEA